MKYLEIKNGTGMVFDNNTPAGLYEQNGSLWFAPGRGLYPYCHILTDFPFRESFDKETKISGISEDTLLKAIAISQKPELIKDI